ncbi:hypothetical protein WISP_86355 [Willisornis vidua]|uniref:PLXC1 protein n=1 Tax=Willisornis vidua TaxID=1566151 RepID=A0ABQ9D406_9PASS|nr:hypothetical protein WISP_86355 [Willisornis vidua]
MRSNLLLYYEEAGGVGVLLTGWTQEDGACQVWEQPSYRQRLNEREVVSCLPDGSTAGVVFQRAGAWYLAVAATYSTSADTNHLRCEPSKSDKETVITVRSMVNLQSTEELGIIKRREEPLHFVDALQWGDYLFFPYYTLKARLGNNTEPPSMAVLHPVSSGDSGLTLKGHVYLDCGCRSLIVSSSLVRQGEGVWWVGVFRHSHNAKAWNTTAVCIFGMEEMKEQACASTHFNMNGNICEAARSIKKLPTLIHSGLVAVYGTVVLNRIVLFLGTDDGQLLKAILNEDMESNCPEVLYEIEEETPIFHKLRLDPVNNNYIYLSSANKHISIQSIEPLWISTLGKSEITVKGENFTRASGIKLILTGITGCKPDVGGRKITTTGRNFNVVDSVIISDDQRSNLTVPRCPGNASEYHYLTPSLSHATEGKVVDMMLKVDTTFIPCVKLHYHPDPVFINYQLHTELDPDLELKIYKENDNLNISKAEVEVYLLYMSGAETKKILFSVQNITKKPHRSTILCKFKREGTDKIDFSTVKVFVKLGNFEHEVKPTSSYIYLYVLILLPIVVGVIIAAFIVTRYKSKELTRKQSQQLELLEYEIRKEIREGGFASIFSEEMPQETIGEPFYLLVTTLNQRINKGPVDAITCKALYTLNEDWLLWQVSEFKTVTVNIIFEKVPENESGDGCQTIQVNVLDCDTIGQAKEKSLQAFFNKNGFLYGLQLDEIGLELVSEEQQRELLDIDGSSEVMEDGIRKLNTIGHYEISNGATIKVFKKKANIRSDVDYSDEHCHLILPDSEANKDVKGAGHKGKQKFKVKEMYLTKLLSTKSQVPNAFSNSANNIPRVDVAFVGQVIPAHKIYHKVAIHSVVEKLFRSIWSLPNNKAPVAIKYFFDFLDAQAESKKITDPDVVHIWKTNSLPLRFWVNILKNPQFVFDIKKTSHIDGCLSVIAQAFMDAFSLAEQTLGKEAPTNKLLYAKDIPLYKKEVKAYYKAIRDLPPLTTAEVEEFLAQESKKHENEFNEKVALFEIYRYIVKYYDEIVSKLERERGFEEVQKQLQQVKALFDEKKKCKWL